MEDHADLQAILEPLYAAVLEPERLAEFSQALCAATDSHVGAVMVHDAAHARGRLDLLVGADPTQMAAYEQEFAADNPWTRRGQHLMVAGGVMDSDAVLPRAELKRTRYYNEYLRHGDVEQSLALCAQADAHGVVMATLCRSGSLPAYTDGEMALVRRVAPHWANAYAIQRRMSWLEQRVSSLEAAVEAVPMAMLMLDARQRVARMNPAAECLLAQGDVLRMEGRRPEAAHDPLPLRELLHAAVVGDAGGRHAGRVVLNDAAGHHALVANAHPLSAAACSGAHAAVLFLRPVGAQPASGLGPALRGLFNLTASEAALAVALHAHGDLALAAADCRITIGTAQSRLKLIYDKTGERGQTRLMRLLAAVAAVS